MSDWNQPRDAITGDLDLEGADSMVGQLQGRHAAGTGALNEDLEEAAAVERPKPSPPPSAPKPAPPRPVPAPSPNRPSRPQAPAPQDADDYFDEPIMSANERIARGFGKSR